MNVSVGLHFQLKESSSKNTDLQHQLEKAKQQHQELQALQQNTNGKLREAQVLLTRKLLSEALIIGEHCEKEAVRYSEFWNHQFFSWKNCVAYTKLFRKYMPIPRTQVDV